MNIIEHSIQKSKKSTIIFSDVENIKSILEDKSKFSFDYINKAQSSQFTLFKKNITHSDVATFGKMNSSDNFEKNLLTYLSIDQMKEINENSDYKFQVAKQSNIFMPEDFYKLLGINQLKRRKGAQSTKHNHILLNDYANVFIANDSVEYFTYEYTKRIFEKLGKKMKWKKEACDITLSKGEFTPIKIHHAIHGIGINTDVDFHKLRHNIFRNDSLYILIEKTKQGTKNVLIILEKNPIFFTLINETNKSYEKYLVKQRKKLEYTEKEIIDSIEKNRKYQNTWRNMLAEEMMNYTTTDDTVFCPFTLIEGNYYTLSSIFVASHIKPYSLCDINEAFDINNGLLLVANADALFDKYMITVDENKQLIFSFTIDNDYQLKSKLMLLNPIFSMILNEKRMEYLEHHRNRFYELEEIRKK